MVETASNREREQYSERVSMQARATPPVPKLLKTLSQQEQFHSSGREAQ